MDSLMMARMLLFQELRENTFDVIFSAAPFSIKDLNTWLLIKFTPDQQVKSPFSQDSQLKVEASKVVLDWEKWKEIVC